MKMKVGLFSLFFPHGVKVVKVFLVIITAQTRGDYSKIAFFARQFVCRMFERPFLKERLFVE